MRSRLIPFLPLGGVALLAGWPACQPSGTAVPAKQACGFTVLFQNDVFGEIEPCG